MSSKIDLNKLGATLYYFRKANNFTIKEVANYLNICPSKYIMYENGDLYITLTMLHSLSQLYLVMPSDILYPDPKKLNDNILKSHRKRSL